MLTRGNRMCLVEIPDMNMNLKVFLSTLGESWLLL